MVAANVFRRIRPVQAGCHRLTSGTAQMFEADNSLLKIIPDHPAFFTFPDDAAAEITEQPVACDDEAFRHFSPRLSDMLQ